MGYGQLIFPEKRKKLGNNEPAEATLMGRRSQLFKMPTQLRAELDAMLRANGYGDFVALAEWLSEKGCDVSKSAVHRYGRALREADAGFGGVDATIVQVMSQHSGVTVAIRDGLLLELGRLRLREHELLAKIAALDSGTIP